MGSTRVTTWHQTRLIHINTTVRHRFTGPEEQLSPNCDRPQRGLFTCLSVSGPGHYRSVRECGPTTENTRLDKAGCPVFCDVHLEARTARQDRRQWDNATRFYSPGKKIQEHIITIQQQLIEKDLHHYKTRQNM
ncbi:hypothetical protein BaRGS_00020416 [Batillaria attramentaria]